MEGRQEAFMEREWESLDQKVLPILTYSSCYLMLTAEASSHLLDYMCSCITLVY
nr:MAG TPA: hypothetical protein [Crassvirales sp.]